MDNKEIIQKTRLAWPVIFGIIGIVFILSLFSLTAFAYTRSPAGSIITRDEPNGTPVTLTFTGADQIVFDNVDCTSGWRFTLIRDGGGRINGALHTNYGTTVVETIYGFTAGTWHIRFNQYGTVFCNEGDYDFTSDDNFTVTDNLTITYPVDGTNYDLEPNHFEVSYALDDIYASASYQKKLLTIRYGSTPDSLIYYSQDRFFTNTATSSTQFANKTTQLGTKDGYAEATLMYTPDNGQSYVAIAHSDLVHWTLTLPASSSSGTQTDFGIIGNTFRDVGIFLFSPSSASLNQFNTLGSLLQNKPPIGYFTALKSSFTGIASGSATVSIGIGGFHAIFDPLRTGLIWLLWIFYLIFLLKRFIHFNWHL